MINMPELLHNKSAVSIHDGAFQTNKERMLGLTPSVRKIYNPHPASPAVCNIRYLSCVVYTIPYLRILCKFLPNIFKQLFLSFSFQSHIRARIQTAGPARNQCKTRLCHIRLTVLCCCFLAFSFSPFLYFFCFL